MSGEEYFSSLTWIKAGRSNPSGNCVEVGEDTEGGVIFLRNTRDRNGSILCVDRDMFSGLIESAREGALDQLIA